jgi:protein SCO1/2
VRLAFTLALVTGLSLTACSRSREYELRGQIVAIDRSSAKVTIKHEDIRGFMPAMTMAFDVRDPGLIEGHQPGELITATLVVEERGAYLSTIRRTGMAALPEMPPAAPVDVVRTGDQAPDAAFTDQTGRARRFSDWHGQVVAVTFVYTRCPLPNFCPLMDKHFLAVQRVLATDSALRGRAHLVSVSVDPSYDTPKVLAAHAERVSADPAHWTLLTGDPEQLDRFTSRFGVSVVSPPSREPTGAAGAEIVHNLRTAVVDAKGRIVTVLSGNEWTPAELLGHMRTALE